MWRFGASSHGHSRVFLTPRRRLRARFCRRVHWVRPRMTAWAHSSTEKNDFSSSFSSTFWLFSVAPSLAIGNPRQVRLHPLDRHPLLVSYTLHREIPQQVREVLEVLVHDVRQTGPLLPPRVPERVVGQAVPGVVAPLLDRQAGTGSCPGV